MNKKLSFNAYEHWSYIFEKLSDAKAGILVKAIFSYVEDGVIPDLEADELEGVRVGFAVIKRDIDLDQEKRKYISEVRAAAGRKGGQKSGVTRKAISEAKVSPRPKRINKNFTEPSLEEVEEYIKESGAKKVNAQAFYSYNKSIGWTVGKNKIPIKDWKAVVDHWEEKNQKQKSEYPEEKIPSEGTFKTITG